MEESGRDGALRRPRRVQRRKSIGESFVYGARSARFTGGDAAARRPYQSFVVIRQRHIPQHNRKAKGI